MEEKKYRIEKNPDQEFVKELRKRIKRNNGYCPCELVKNPDNKCPCKTFRETGDCGCGLYIKTEVTDL